MSNSATVELRRGIENVEVAAEFEILDQGPGFGNRRAGSFDNVKGMVYLDRCNVETVERTSLP